MNEGREFYGFTWPGKYEAMLEAGRPTDKVLRPCVEDSVNFAATQNLYIEGDNLEVMKIMLKSYARKVKMIYIDPPYNTGHDFIYSDTFRQTDDEAREQFGLYDDEETIRNFTISSYRENTKANPRYHSDWCSMIYPRLKIAQSLLTDDGVIFISIDDNEQAKLRMMCDEIFGESNFVAQLAVRRRGARADSKYLAVVHEYILCYAKDISSFEVGEKVKEADSYPKYDEQRKRYYKTQLLRKWGTNSRREDRPNLYYAIKAPDGSDVYPMLPEGKDGRWRWSEDTMREAIADGRVEFRQEGCWRWSEDTMKKAVADGRVEFVRQGEEWTAYEKIFAPLEGEERTQKYNTWLDDIPNGADTLKKLSIPFDYSKSHELITRLIEIANAKDDSLIMDFFSGSSTTAHAVMSLNAQDLSQRKFIMIQLPEECNQDSEARKAGYATICDIGRERIKRAGNGLIGDTGFRTLRLDSSNYLDVFTSPDDLTQESLDTLSTNLKHDRSPLDLLFMCITDSGLPLSLSYRSEHIDRFTVHVYGDSELVACFDSSLTESVITHVAKHNPLRAIFRDSGFKNSSDRINLEQIFRYYAPDSDIKIL